MTLLDLAGVSFAYSSGIRVLHDIDLSVQAGSLVVQVAGSSQTVRRGETVRYVASVQHAIANNGKTAAKAILVVEYSPGT